MSSTFPHWQWLTEWRRDVYKVVVKHRARTGYALLSAGRFEELVSRFASDVRFVFAGEHALASDFRGSDRAFAWFERVDGGREYRNGGLQFIRLRWGKVTEDH